MKEKVRMVMVSAMVPLEDVIKLEKIADKTPNWKRSDAVRDAVSQYIDGCKDLWENEAVTR
jgi:metal-responsive CopG/Arc/MetJ family transcriptional regulator